MERILALSLAHPAWGCNKLSEWLKLECIQISFVTVQNIPNKHSLGTRYERWLRLETEYGQESFEAYRPASFKQLVESFTEYKEAM